HLAHYHYTPLVPTRRSPDLHSVHGTVAAVKGLQYSCDNYFYTIANIIGIDPIAQMGHELGLGQPTNFSVAAEVPGVMPDTAYHEDRKSTRLNSSHQIISYAV